MIRTSDAFPTTRLLVKDFDGTVAKTFDKSPNGIGINESHETVVEDMFGTNVLEQYIKNGGLRNRAPSELIEDLAPDAGNELGELVATFTRKKLDILLSEIGEKFDDGGIWPRPMPGYLEMLVGLEQNNHDGKPQINDMILSSGHEEFIRKTYEKWGVRQPDYVLAEEATRVFADSHGLPISDLIKPSALLMTSAVNVWREDYGLSPTQTISPEDRTRTVLVGDGPDKDGLLAVNSNVPFVLIRPGKSLEDWRQVGTHLKIGHFGLARAQHDV